MVVRSSPNPFTLNEEPHIFDFLMRYDIANREEASPFTVHGTGTRISLALAWIPLVQSPAAVAIWLFIRRREWDIVNRLHV